MTEQAQVNKFDEAFVKTQSVIENPEFDRVVKYGNTSFPYASLEAVLKVVKKAANPNGIHVTQWPQLLNEKIVLITRITHLSGESRESILPLDLNPSAKWQEKGSAITYARRYVLCSIFGIFGEEDDDAISTLNSPKRIEIEGLIEEMTKDQKAKFWNLAKCKKLDEIPVDRLDLAIRVATAILNNQEVK